MKRTCGIITTIGFIFLIGCREKVPPPPDLKTFFEAIRENNVAKVKAALDVNPQWVRAKGETLKNPAGEHIQGFPSDPSMIARTCVSALHSAVSHDSLEVAELLIERGADVNAKSSRSPVYPSISTDKGYTPLDFALANQGKPECPNAGRIIETLRAHGAKPSSGMK